MFSLFEIFLKPRKYNRFLQRLQKNGHFTLKGYRLSDCGVGGGVDYAFTHVTF